MRLGNIQFNEVESRLGYKLDDDDKVLWNKYHENLADLGKSSKESCFHIFDIPTCIIFKGLEAEEAILKMFTQDKLINPMGKFSVMEFKQ